VKNILILTDFSENAGAAEAYAFALAMNVEADLILYNVYPKRSPNLSGNIVWPHDQPGASFELESISNLQSRVDEFTHQLKKITRPVYKPSISHFGNEGSVTDKLNEVLDEKDIWLVVMGTKGESRASTALFGSHVFKVLEAVNRPVLVVPQNADYSKLDGIAYATDLLSPDLDVVEWIYQFSKSLDLKLSVVHVSAFDTVEEEKTDLKARELAYREKFPGVSIEPFVGENVAHSLQKLAGRSDIDILALMHRKQGFFSRMFHASMAHQVIRHTELPILVFPENDL
jgi:nucleotide-binding universal stress UspA family protein